MSVLKYNFSGHESFPCKSLWLKKGYDFVVAGNQFSSAEAVMELGVGKNMVASIRYWLKAFGVIDSTGQTTTLGNYLLDDESGRDKYIEDLGTLWILHFNIINNLNIYILTTYVNQTWNFYEHILANFIFCLIVIVSYSNQFFT